MFDPRDGSWVRVACGKAVRRCVTVRRCVGIGRSVGIRLWGRRSCASLEWVSLDVVWIDQAQTEDSKDVVHRVGLFGSDLALLDALAWLVG